MVCRLECSSKRFGGSREQRASRGGRRRGRLASRPHRLTSCRGGLEPARASKRTTASLAVVGRLCSGRFCPGDASLRDDRSRAQSCPHSVSFRGRPSSRAPAARAAGCDPRIVPLGRQPLWLAAVRLAPSRNDPLRCLAPLWPPSLPRSSASLLSSPDAPRSLLSTTTTTTASTTIMDAHDQRPSKVMAFACGMCVGSASRLLARLPADAPLASRQVLCIRVRSCSLLPARRVCGKAWRSADAAPLRPFFKASLDLLLHDLTSSSMRSQWLPLRLWCV